MLNKPGKNKQVLNREKITKSKETIIHTHTHTKMFLDVIIDDEKFKGFKHLEYLYTHAYTLARQIRP